MNNTRRKTVGVIGSVTVLGIGVLMSSQEETITTGNGIRVIDQTVVTGGGVRIRFEFEAHDSTTKIRFTTLNERENIIGEESFEYETRSGNRYEEVEVVTRGSVIRIE